ncbi:MAG: methyl-accepting chemotaxis protein [Stellaceae bacterium]
MIISIKSRLIAGATILLVVATAISTGISVATIDASSNDDYRAITENAARTARETMSAIDARLVAYADLFSRNPSIANALAKDDMAQLEEIVLREYGALHKIDSTVKTLEITNDKGIVVFRGHNPEKKGDDKSGTAMIKSALAATPAHGLTVSITTHEMAQDAVVPLMSGDRVVGTLKVGSYLREDTAKYIKELTGTDVAFFVGGKPNASTLAGSTDPSLPDGLVARMTQGSAIVEVADIGGKAYEAGYFALKGESGNDAVVATYLSRDTLTAQQRDLLFKLIGAAIVLMAVLLVLALLMTRTIVRPLKSLRAAMDRLTHGDTSFELAERARGDEIGEMVNAVAVLKEATIEAKRLATKEAEDQVTRQLRARTIEELAKGFEGQVSEIIGSLVASAQRMQASAQAMSATAEQTRGQATAVAAASEEASANVQTVATSAEELAASINDVGGQISTSTTVARQASEDVQRSNAVASSLTTAAQRVGEVVALINNIASQTNLLALNATIEAARAGEAGKGFAVVASEVKTLASQTAKATDEIKSQIESIQSATDNTVSAIQGIGSTIERMNEIGASVASAIDQQRAATQEIARNVQQAASGTQRVSSNIQIVNEAAVSTGTAATEVLSATRQLATESTTLREAVDEFLKNIRAA